MTVEELALIILRAPTFADAKREIAKAMQLAWEEQRLDDEFYDPHANENHLGQD